MQVEHTTYKPLRSRKELTSYYWKTRLTGPISKHTSIIISCRKSVLKSIGYATIFMSHETRAPRALYKTHIILLLL